MSRNQREVDCKKISRHLMRGTSPENTRAIKPGPKKRNHVKCALSHARTSQLRRSCVGAADGHAAAPAPQDAGACAWGHAASAELNLGEALEAAGDDQASTFSGLENSAWPGLGESCSPSGSVKSCPKSCRSPSAPLSRREATSRGAEAAASTDGGGAALREHAEPVTATCGIGEALVWEGGEAAVSKAVLTSCGL